MIDKNGFKPNLFLRGSYIWDDARGWKVATGVFQAWREVLMEKHVITGNRKAVRSYWRSEKLKHFVVSLSLTCRSPLGDDGGGQGCGDPTKQSHGVEGPRVGGLHLCLEPRERPARLRVSIYFSDGRSLPKLLNGFSPEKADHGSIPNWTWFSVFFISTFLFSIAWSFHAVEFSLQQVLNIMFIYCRQIPLH